MTQKVSAFSSLRTVLRCIPCVLTALGFLIMAVFLAPSASAHDVLVSSDPDDGEEVEAPSEFSLTFNNDPIDMESAIVITGPDGDDAEIETDPIVEGRDVYTELPDLEPGEYDRSEERRVGKEGMRVGDGEEERREVEEGEGGE